MTTPQKDKKTVSPQGPPQETTGSPSNTNPSRKNTSKKTHTPPSKNVTLLREALRVMLFEGYAPKRQQEVIDLLDSLAYGSIPGRDRATTGLRREAPQAWEYLVTDKELQEFAQRPQAPSRSPEDTGHQDQSQEPPPWEFKHRPGQTHDQDSVPNPFVPRPHKATMTSLDEALAKAPQALPKASNNPYAAHAPSKANQGHDDEGVSYSEEFDRRSGPHIQAWVDMHTCQRDEGWLPLEELHDVIEEVTHASSANILRDIIERYEGRPMVWRHTEHHGIQFMAPGRYMVQWYPLKRTCHRTGTGGSGKRLEDKDMIDELDEIGLAQGY